VSARVRLGDWTSPSGNNVVAFVEPDTGDGVRHLALAWDTSPPLCESALIFYLVVVLPAATRRAREYLERPGSAVVVL
jgi:hypothetical protein